MLIRSFLGQQIEATIRDQKGVWMLVTGKTVSPLATAWEAWDLVRASPEEKATLERIGFPGMKPLTRK
jgi:hypothetical protein